MRNAYPPAISTPVDEIVDFEQQITDDGYVLVKFFFHISKKEQKKRLKLLDDQKSTAGA